MHPREFIEKNIKQLLQKDGFSSQAINDGCADALIYFDRTAVFNKGKCFCDCFAVAKKTAQKVKKIEDKFKKKNW